MSNLGVAFLPRFTVEKELAQNAVSEITLDKFDNTLTSVYAYHNNKWRSPALEIMLQLLDNYGEAQNTL